MLHTINHNHRSKLFCGVAAIAAITGKSTKEIIQAVRRNRLSGGGHGGRTGEGRVAFMNMREMVPVLKALGFSATFTRLRPRPTVEKFIREHNTQQPMIVLAGHHFRAVSGGKCSDQFAQYQPIEEQGECWKPTSFVWGIVKLNGTVAA